MYGYAVSNRAVYWILAIREAIPSRSIFRYKPRRVSPRDRAVCEMFPAARWSAPSIISRSRRSTAAASVTLRARPRELEETASAPPKIGESSSGVISAAAWRHRHGALDLVAELTDVAGPAEGVEQIERLGAQPDARLDEPLATLRAERTCSGAESPRAARAAAGRECG